MPQMTSKIPQSEEARSGRDTATGQKGAAVSPPRYGIDFVDTAKELTAHDHETSSSRAVKVPDGSLPLSLSQPRQLGNHFSSRLLQAKLTVGQPNGPYEQEADRVADEVMRMPEPLGPKTPDEGNFMTWFRGKLRLCQPLKSPSS
ncbi:MAG: hypothetical protein U1F76_09060 [Candidatus Competibacteraceae bacterium]